MKELKFLWVEVTSKCNMSCTHCYSNSSPNSSLPTLKEDEIHRIIKEGANLGCQQIQFIGGEPTTVSYLPELINMAKEHDYKFIEIFTNLVKMNKKLLHILTNTGACIATSVYSDNPYIHDKITKKEGSHLLTTTHIKKLLENGVPVRAGVIRMPENKNCIEETMQFLKNMGVSNVHSDKMRAIGRGNKSSSELSITEKVKQLCGRCADNTLAIKQDGSVAMCVMSGDIPVGNVKSDSLEKINESRKLYEARELVKSIHVKATNSCYPDRHCDPTCSPNCSPTCSPIACDPRSCWPSFQRTPNEHRVL